MTSLGKRSGQKKSKSLFHLVPPWPPLLPWVSTAQFLRSSSVLLILGWEGLLFYAWAWRTTAHCLFLCIARAKRGFDNVKWLKNKKICECKNLGNLVFSVIDM